MVHVLGSGDFFTDCAICHLKVTVIDGLGPGGWDMKGMVT